MTRVEGLIAYLRSNGCEEVVPSIEIRVGKTATVEALGQIQKEPLLRMANGEKRETFLN